MKSSKIVLGWRPIMGVAIVGALALGVSALAGPRGTDEAVRGTVKTGTDATRLVTGDPAQINANVAAVPTMIMALNPIDPPGGLPPYPPGCTIVGNELRCDRTDGSKSGFRAWFHVQLSGWGPKNPEMAAYQVKVDCSGYYHSDCNDVNPDTGLDGLDLIPAVQACAGNADCRPPDPDGFGEPWARCVGGFCTNGYMIGGQATQVTSPEDESWCETNDGGCNQADVDTSTCNYLWFAVTDAQTPDGRTDNGQLYYGGTLVLEIPAGAKGKYVVNLNQDGSFAGSPGTPPVPFDSLEETGFVINFVGGSCCHNLGTPLAGCFDQCINRSDCETAANFPFVFTPSTSTFTALCDNKPTADGCSQCTTPGPDDPLCDDNDACTDDICRLIGTPPVGVCDHPFISGFNPVKGGAGDTGNCCDPGTGGFTTKDDGDDCTADACSLADNRGQATHTPAVGPCSDGNPCTTADTCNGVASQEDGGCVGTDVNSITCLSSVDCPLDPLGVPYACIDGKCFCTLTPKVTFVLDTTDPKTCIGGFFPGAPCAKDSDCPGGGTCDLFPANCFDEGQKIAALVHIGSAGSPINGGQLLMTYDPSCVDFNSVRCLPPYGTTVYGPIVDESAGTIFIACGVDPFAGVNGPLGNTNMVALNFTMIGQCNNCDLCFASTNPQNSYLVNDGGYKVGIESQCKEIAEYGDLVLNIPDNIKVNSDCDIPAANVAWAAPNASFSCGDVNLTCRGAHESGLSYGADSLLVMGGGLLPQGASSFCCYAWAKDKCEQAVGCPGAVNDCPGTPKPDGCWTVEVNDETSLDIHIQLEPPQAADADGETRCIEFCLYGDCTLEQPVCFAENVLFDGLFNFIGKANGKIKVPKGKYGCITAQDQLHSLRSCADPDCIDGQLKASFKGDPTYGGNWLIMGNLDAWKKNNPLEDPSLDTIDILDFGKFVSQFGVCYEDRLYGCHEGPHADIDGDGCVTTADYQFVNRNFLVSSKECCCGPSAAGMPAPLVEVTIDQLNAMGEGDLAVADLNGDGVLNAADMDAFTQGVRPAKSNDRKGGKGLRSGR